MRRVKHLPNQQAPASVADEDNSLDEPYSHRNETRRSERQQLRLKRQSVTVEFSPYSLWESTETFDETLPTKPALWHVAPAISLLLQLPPVYAPQFSRF